MDRKYRHLEWADRRIIEKLRKSGHSLRHIASILGVSASTVSRELARNTCGLQYNSHLAQESARCKRASANKLRRKLGPAHLDFIREQLELTLSPEQVASRFPDAFGFKVSTRTVYLSIYRFDRERPEPTKPLTRLLRMRSKISRRKWRLAHVDVCPRPNIAQRPSGAEDRSEYGHWEMDLFVGRGNSKAAALVMVERKSRYSIVHPVENKTGETINRALETLTPGLLVRSITTDNGSEFLDHRTITKTTRAPVFYCNPYRSWEKGSVENTIGLYRHFFPKGHPLSTNIMHYIIAQRLINSRPRKVLEFKTPASYLDKIIIKQ